MNNFVYELKHYLFKIIHTLQIYACSTGTRHSNSVVWYGYHTTLLEYLIETFKENLSMWPSSY